jgi:bifunctional non-homologous end joining protein LigD
MKKKAEITHPEKLYWPDEHITKGELIDYYRNIAPYILPYIKNRPLSLRRQPNGIQDEGFFQKDASESTPDWIKTVEILAESTGKMVHYHVVNDVESLLYIANLGCIEMNPWNSTVNKLDNPDYVVMDIDPSDKNTFDEVIDVALTIRQLLDEMAVEGFCKTSGATGMHVYIPFGKKYSYDQARDFAGMLAHMVVERMPDTTTLERSLSKRKKNQIYVDYLQNRIGQTLACAYSARPKPGATVSAPLEWSEVQHGLSPQDFTIKNIFDRLEKKGDLFKGVLSKGINLHNALQNFPVPAQD